MSTLPPNPQNVMLINDDDDDDVCVCVCVCVLENRDEEVQKIYSILIQVSL